MAKKAVFLITKERDRSTFGDKLKKEIIERIGIDNYKAIQYGSNASRANEKDILSAVEFMAFTECSNIIKEADHIKLFFATSEEAITALRKWRSLFPFIFVKEDIKTSYHIELHFN